MISNNISVNSEKKPASKLKIQEISLIIQKTIDKAIICYQYDARKVKQKRPNSKKITQNSTLSKELPQKTQEKPEKKPNVAVFSRKPAKLDNFFKTRASKSKSPFTKSQKLGNFVKKTAKIEGNSRKSREIREETAKKYDNFSRKSRSSAIFERIEENIKETAENPAISKRNCGYPEESSGNFLRNLEKNGVLQINGWNSEDDADFLGKSSANPRKSSVFEAEMLKFLETTFQRPETPPFYVKHEEIIEKNARKSAISQENAGKTEETGVFFDPVLRQYYDSQKNEYFKLI